MNRAYEKHEMEVLLFRAEDIVVTSGVNIQSIRDTDSVSDE